MTEAEWLVCLDPRPMLREVGDRPGPRKFRLFACACCRAVWDCLTPAQARTAVEVAERHADGQTVPMELVIAGCNLTQFMKQSHKLRLREEVKAALLAADVTSLTGHFGGQVHLICTQAAHARSLSVVGSKREQVRDAMFARQAHLLRCIVGNPFRSTPALSSRWLAWNDGAVAKIAQVIYNDRTFDRLPMLADALEDAGCDDASILQHCRTPGEHARGCWVLDLLLKKESESEQ